MKALRKENIVLLLIVVISIIFRFCCIDKQGGLWYDEIVSFKEASQPNVLFLILYTLKTDVHLPLYPLILHFWANLFSFSDYSLRSFSAVCGVLSVIVSYFVGLNLKSVRTGLICSSVFAVSSFMIFYSQSVRIASFLALLSVCSLLFFVKIIKDYRNKWNYFFYILFALAIINGYTIGFIFVIIQILVLIAYVLLGKDDSKNIIARNLLISFVAIFILSLPLFIYFCFNLSYYTSQVNGYYTDWSSLFVIVQNWFSPVLVGLNNNPVHYIKSFLGDFKFGSLFFVVLPIILSVYFIFRALKKDKLVFSIFCVALGFVLIELIAFKLTNFKLLSRYTIIVVPNILIVLGYGLSSIDFKKKLNVFLISIFFLTHLAYLVLNEGAAFRKPRDGFRPLASVLNNSGINDSDFVVVWNRTEILDKYIEKKLHIISLLRNFAYSSEVILVNDSKLKQMNLQERKKALRNYFASDYIPVNTIYLIDAIYDHLKPGQKFIITTTPGFDSYTQKSFTKLVNDDKKYDIISYNDLLTINSLVQIKPLAYKKFHFVKKIRTNNFVIIIFQKDL